MIIQVAGLVLVTASVIMAGFYFTEIRRTKLIAASQERMQRAEHDQRTFENNAIRMYENERQQRIEAETKRDIYKHQLDRARQQMATVKIGK